MKNTNVLYCFFLVKQMFSIVSSGIIALSSEYVTVMKMCNNVDQKTFGCAFFFFFSFLIKFLLCFNIKKTTT